jgi:phosphoribosylamine-glycine ligase
MENMENMKILVLAGGSDQIALIKELKKRNHEVVLVDYFQNPPAKLYADKHIIENTLDAEIVKKIALSENAQLITTACTDQALLTVAKVSEELSLPCYISYQTALNVTNKAYMKKVLLYNNIPTARYVIVDSANLKTINKFEFPVVVKPVDCNSSKGVKKVHNADELSNALKDAISFSRTKTAIVEEFKEGIEISADFYIENDNVKILSVTGSNKIKNTNSFTITQSFYPVVSSEKGYQILEIGQQIANAFNLRNTPLLIQLIEKDGNFNVIEFSARMGGGSKYKLIEVLSGVDIMRTYVDLILGANPIVHPQKQVNFALMNYIYCFPGTFYKTEGLNELRQKNIIDDYFLYKTEGMEIEKSETSGDRVAGFLITDPDKNKLLEKLHCADNTIKVVNSLGKDTMKHGLYFTI